jgi:small-conductance mechanosensitive channel
MLYRRRFLHTILILALTAFAFPAGARAQSPVDDTEVLKFLERTIGWQHEVSSLEQSPGNSREALSADALRQNSLQAVRYAFEFARAAIAIPDAPAERNENPNSDRSRNLMQIEAATDKRIEELQRQIGELDRQIQAAPQRLRAGLTARRDVLAAEMNLTKARRDALHGTLGFLNAAPGDGISAWIKELERTVPGLQATAKPGETVPAARATPSQELHPETAGIAELIADVFSLNRKMSQIDALAEKTDSLRQENERLRAPIRKAFQEVIRRGDQIAQDVDAASPEVLKAEKNELDGLVLRFNQLIAATGPLSRQAVPLDASYSSLLQWRSVLSEQNSDALRYLLLRLGMLGFAILIIFAFAEMWRRATMRYVRELRRRRQFLLLRRIVVGCTIAVFVLLSFVTEFGSLATFAGFSAAGIAVALQSVILSVVAYFFLVGRWGVKVGDRVTVSGVVGDVIEIGLFRMYLMELKNTTTDLYPTGRMVVFPNAVFFQPSAMFKQFPGIAYTWHSVSLTLNRDCDYALAQKQVMQAVESVYADSRETIESQHEAARTSMNLHTETPRPEPHVRFLDSGLEIAVRYPVEISRAAETEERITRELLNLLETEPNLKDSVMGTPKIQTAV